MKKKDEKKEKAKLYKSKRQFWEINPVTRIVPNKKKYNRNKQKYRWRGGPKYVFCYV